MLLYRIAKTEERARDLSGTGAFKAGGRWNNEGVFALYTSESRALALLELLVHLEEAELPPELYIISLKVDDDLKISSVDDTLLPRDWRLPGNIILKNSGDKLLKSAAIMGFRVRSAVLPEEYNIVLNPLFPGFAEKVKIVAIEKFEPDQRLREATD